MQIYPSKLVFDKPVWHKMDVMGNDDKQAPIGVIGGSGFYLLDNLTDAQWVEVDTPFGKPSDAVLRGKLDGRELAFIPRHGRGHRILPSDINYRANIYAFKQMGVKRMFTFSAVGSLREDYRPGQFVAIDQYVDLTHRRISTFSSTGFAVHVAMANPVCDELRRTIIESAPKMGLEIHPTGTCIVMEGPQFSTKAESAQYRRNGWDIIGMTNMPEAKLAREAGICYSGVAMVTDYDCWHPDHDSVTSQMVLDVMRQNVGSAQRLLLTALPAIGGLSERCEVGCQKPLNNAIITAPDKRDPKLEALW